VGVERVPSGCGASAEGAHSVRYAEVFFLEFFPEVCCSFLCLFFFPGEGAWTKTVIG